MAAVLHALIPIFTLILAGALLRRFAFLPDQFWPAAEKLTYYLLTPALLIHSLAGKQLDDLPWQGLCLTVQGTVLFSAGLLWCWWFYRRREEGAMFTSVFQGGVRFNTFVALAVAEALFGTRGLLIAAVGAGFMIPLINLLCVSTFTLAVDSDSLSPGRFLKRLATNPLILGCLLGGLVNLSGLGLHPVLDGMLELPGRAAFPLGLMAVGAAYRKTGLAKRWSSLLASSLVQLLCKPLIAGQLPTFFGLDGLPASVAVLLFSVPTAPSAFILSRQLGGDHETMASIITLQTLLAFFSLPVTLLVLG